MAENQSIPKDLIFICAQPHDSYFMWQCEVLIVNFREHRISQKMQILIWYPKTGLDNGWQKLVKKYREVKFHFYQDQDVDLDLYIPQLRPQILKLHFEKFPELKSKKFFYHDSDIIFNFLPDFKKLCEGDVNWQSDTSSYLDYNYLKSKEVSGGIPENQVIDKLCEIGGISMEIIKSYSKNTGGAQYILKDIDSDFWSEVEENCIRIRRFLKDEVNTRYFKSESEGFQSWCADMWAVNFALWKRGKVTNITQDLDFSWATDSLETYSKKPIFHNAGATGKDKRIFYKGGWINTSPLGKNLKISPIFASSKYVEAIKKVK